MTIFHEAPYDGLRGITLSQCMDGTMTASDHLSTYALARTAMEQNRGSADTYTMAPASTHVTYFELCGRCLKQGNGPKVQLSHAWKMFNEGNSRKCIRTIAFHDAVLKFLFSRDNNAFIEDPPSPLITHSFCALAVTISFVEWSRRKGRAAVYTPPNMENNARSGGHMITYTEYGRNIIQDAIYELSKKMDDLQRMAIDKCRKPCNAGYNTNGQHDDEHDPGHPSDDYIRRLRDDAYACMVMISKFMLHFVIKSVSNRGELDKITHPRDDGTGSEGAQNFVESMITAIGEYFGMEIPVLVCDKIECLKKKPYLVVCYDGECIQPVLLDEMHYGSGPGRYVTIRTTEIGRHTLIPCELHGDETKSLVFGDPTPTPGVYQCI